jgi:N-acetylmuramoyl-L-alanine amidase
MSRKKKFYLYLVVILLPFLIEVAFYGVSAVPAQNRRSDLTAEQGRPNISARQPRPTASDGFTTIDPLRASAEKKNRAAGVRRSDKAQVTGLRLLSWKGYTRIMLDLSQETKYEVRRLKEDPAQGMPLRIYIDILGARLALASKEPAPAEDGLLRQVRLGQYSADIVRVVLDMNSFRDHKAFILPDPFRLIIDVYGQAAPESASPKDVAGKPAQSPRAAVAKVANPSSPRPASSGLRKIVLDPGHGGKDPGAIGPDGIAEKDIVLSIAKKLALKLRKDMGVEVVLTRTDDRFVPLAVRTKLANDESADLFISLHMNASENAETMGVETYYLDKTTDEAANRLAARENGTSEKNISDLQFILADMRQNMKLEDSITLAHHLQGSVVGGMSRVMGDVKDLGVKKAIFYVLVGAYMPSALVEMFFISNRNEARAMSRMSNQEAMVDALFEGIQKYGQSNLHAKTL